MKYLINETTKEALANEYIEGNMELEDVQKKVIEMHKKGFEENE